MKSGFLALALTLSLFAQTRQAFEAVSIHENPGPWRKMVDYSASGSRLMLGGWRIGDLIQEAYGLKPYQVILPPETINAVFDIAAKADGDAERSKAEFRPLLQTMLEERFHLKFHREQREIPVYAMVIGKGGPKFQQSDPDQPAKSLGGVYGRNQSVEFQQGTMEDLAHRIPMALFTDRPVINHTGLTGKYTVKLVATPEFRINNNPQPDDIRVFDAIQQQLGLKLEPRKESMEVLVVDHVEIPSGN
ncbi:MAG TPA: TIGR03435 family protein [Bryobacteraceae bacterium]|nr:TIGR03435 family protein [Bryobacteraceae bacterium]